MTNNVNPTPRYHHSTVAAKEFRQQNADAYGIDNPVIPPVTPPSVDVTSPPPPPVTSPSTDDPTIASTEKPGNTPSTTSVFDPGIEFSAPPVINNETQQTPRELELQQELEQLRSQNHELTAGQQQVLAQRQAEQQELEELRAFRRQQEIDRLMNLDNLEMDNIDAAAAQEIGKKVIRPLLERQQEAFEKRFSDVTKTLVDNRQAHEKLMSQMSEQEQANLLSTTNQRIYDAHPDFDQIRQTREFTQYLDAKVRGSSLKLGKLIADEYHNGNADFVVNAINEYKKGRPSLEDIAAAPAAGTGVTPANVEEEKPQYTLNDVAEWQEQLVTGKLSRTKFKENMVKYREALASAN